MDKNTYCSYCGTYFIEDKFPKNCSACSNITYVNPLPVSAVIIPCFVDTSPGVLTVKRSIQPKLGEWALPGGFMELGETWQESSVREVKEEIGLELDINGIELLDVKNADNGNLLIFSVYKYPLFWDNIKFVPNREVSNIGVSDGTTDLAFPTHTEVIKKYLLNLFLK